jgi:serine/threonine-protein kinase HipA
MRTYDVLLNGTRVGHLSETTDGRVAFRFVEEYKQLPHRPVLSQSFEDDLDRTYRSKRDTLPAFFANLVPEGQLRDVIESSLSLPRGDSLALLSAVSTDLPGALEIVESGAEMHIGTNGKDDSENGEHAWQPALRADFVPADVELRFSLAGVQMKFSLIRDNEKLTLPAHGARGEWIVKLDSSRFPRVVENEFATMEWARASGFDVPELHLMAINALPEPLQNYAGESKNVLAVARYDRVGQTRIHQEDFAQVVGLPPSMKYDQIGYSQCAALIRNLVGDSGYQEFIARLTFVIASGNADAHLKNWSLLYQDGVVPSLTPLYDQVATVAWPELVFKLALKFAGTREFLQVDESAFTRLATRAGADPRSTIITVRHAIERIVSGWRASHASEILPVSHAAALRAYWLRAPLFTPLASDLFST